MTELTCATPDAGIFNFQFSILNPRRSRVNLQPVTTYNFEVSNFHTYFVGHEGVWVHNRCNRGDRILATPEGYQRYKRLQAFLYRRYGIYISMVSRRASKPLGLFREDYITLRSTATWETLNHEISHLLFDRRVVRRNWGRHGALQDPLRSTAATLSEVLASYSTYRRPELTLNLSGEMVPRFGDSLAKEWARHVLEWGLLKFRDKKYIGAVGGEYIDARLLVYQRAVEVYGRKYVWQALKPPQFAWSKVKTENAQKYGLLDQE